MWFLEGIDCLYMVFKMNVLNGVFYKREIFQPKYHWVEIYLVAIQNQCLQLFCWRDNAFSQYMLTFALVIAMCPMWIRKAGGALLMISLTSNNTVVVL